MAHPHIRFEVHAGLFCAVGQCFDHRFAFFLHQFTELPQLDAEGLRAQHAGDVGEHRPLQHPGVEHVQTRQLRLEALGHVNGILTGGVAVGGTIGADQNALYHD